MRLAIMSMRGREKRCVTVAMQTAFLRSYRAGSIARQAHVLKLGRRSTSGAVKRRGVDFGELLVHHSMRYAKVIGGNRA